MWPLRTCSNLFTWGPPPGAGRTPHQMIPLAAPHFTGTPLPQPFPPQTSSTCSPGRHHTGNPSDMFKLVHLDLITKRELPAPSSLPSNLLDNGRLVFNWKAFFVNTCLYYYHPRMRVGNVFGHVCLSVQAITFEPLDIETSFWYAGTSWPYLGQVWISRSLGLGQGHMRKMIVLLISTC